MEDKDFLISDEAPQDTSTYKEGQLGIKEKPQEGQTKILSFLDLMKGANLNE